VVGATSSEGFVNTVFDVNIAKECTLTNAAVGGWQACDTL